MYKALVNNFFEFEVDLEKQTLNGEAFRWDVLAQDMNRFHIIKDNRSYNVEILEADRRSKNFLIKVNHSKYEVSIKDHFDEILKKLGMDVSGKGKVNELKAPMPGLVLEVAVSEGQHLKKGDPVVVLEAMKMENTLKSPSDVTVNKILVKKTDKVEKNQVLVTFS